MYFHHDVVLTKTCYYDSASSFWKILTFQISTILKKAYFSQNFKLPHNYSPDYLFCKHLILQNILSQWSSLIKTSYNNSTSFFWKIFPFQISIVSKMPFFLKVSNCRIITAQTTFFENIQYGKIYFHNGLVLTKTS